MLFMFAQGWAWLVHLTSPTHLASCAPGDPFAGLRAALVGPAEGGRAEGGTEPPVGLGGGAGQEEEGEEEGAAEGTPPALVKPTTAGGLQRPVPLSGE